MQKFQPSRCSPTYFVPVTYAGLQNYIESVCVEAKLPLLVRKDSNKDVNIKYLLYEWKKFAQRM